MDDADRLQSARLLGAMYLSYDNDRDAPIDCDCFAATTDQLAELIDAITEEANKDTIRLDFAIAEKTSWYDRYRGGGNGTLCWGRDKRYETKGKTMREAIDKAIQESITPRSTL